ncbi:Vacuolar sorting protein 9 domain containing protein [Coccidioides posadasii C735 delta SOWgp]|uniref:Vacuolar sorting protein 9 domain containing protein n=1 Tax=Coccidioides posadasii (strain C735) TaxID=222929 RepID=C5P5R2_COCP7|nr:Vacuolar sorting protein 9 domain containing protein [Coccidioides posadasii C735 delta SOWgp]EER28052.1 Vacuolar sorting protein 9 domain containing protein [Coccidioides posadasii C735 delta SOWgp]|eukprot:XP_003070197.1 Vacuolar sorting protein 9 domain containing protein [Coccidioides posadasii C735 delta SOWgp]
MPPSSEVYTSSPSPTPDNKQNQEPPLSGVGGPGSKEPAAPSIRTSPTGLLSPEDGEKDTNLFNGAMDESKPTMEDNVSSGDTMKMEPEDKPSGSHPERSSEENMRPPTQPMESLSVSKGAPDTLPALQLDTDTDSTLPPPPPQKDNTYIDPTPKTPQAPYSPLTTPTYADKDLPDVPRDVQTAEAGGKESDKEGEDRKCEGSQSEIQSIIEQFADETTSLRQEEIMSPRLELAAHPRFPPRKSSLEPVPSSLDGAGDQQSNSRQPQTSSILSNHSRRSLSPPAVPPKSPPSVSQKATVGEETESTGPPPPEPEPDQPFDFHRFLEQLRHRTADPVAKFLRSFLTEFGKRQWMVHEQVKIIGDFLAFITNKMAMCDVWKEVSDVEFDNAKEGMEKLVMNRLYSQTFSPAIPPPPVLPRNRSRGRKKDLEKLLGPGRRGQHQEDVERDEILAQKIRIYSWVREEHLDIPPVSSNGHRFLHLAQQELLKIKGYRAPRDKVICILNCCKVIFGLLKNSRDSDTSADSFMPLLIYVVLKANPEHLVSNLQYILRFRNQEKLGGEAGYYLSSLSGAIQFIETLDRTSLTVSQEEFDRNVEEAVSAIAEKHKEAEQSLSREAEKPLASREITPRNSEELGSRSTDSPYASNPEDNPSMAGLLRTIQKPLTTIGRIFSDETESQQQQQRTLGPPQQNPGLASAPYQQQQQQQQSNNGLRGVDRQRSRNEPPTQQQRNGFEAQEAAARQASAEAAEAHRIQRAEHADVVETLSGMFPNLDKDVIDDVVRMKEGRVGLAVDACLALSAE